MTKKKNKLDKTPKDPHRPPEHIPKGQRGNTESSGGVSQGKAKEDDNYVDKGKDKTDIPETE